MRSFTPQENEWRPSKPTNSFTPSPPINSSTLNSGGEVMDGGGGRSFSWIMQEERIMIGDDWALSAF